MAETVVNAQEISLNAVRYKVTGPVRRTLSSVYPEKTVIGDYTKDSHPSLSTLALSDHRGGIGQDIYQGDGSDGPANRSWYSTADTRHKGHLILPPLVTNTGTTPAGFSTAYTLMSYKGAVYGNLAATSTGIYLYTPGTDTWGSRLLATVMASAVWRWAGGAIAGTTYIACTNESNELYYYDGSTWATRTLGSIGGILAFGKERLWGVSYSNYKLWYTFTPGSGEIFLRETPLLRPLIKGASLLFARNAEGDFVLHLVTNEGLFAYDEGNDEWIATGLQFPDNSGTGGGTTGIMWRDDIYLSARSTVYRYSIRSGEAVITAIGPDRDDGLPSTKAHLITDMVAAQNDILISTATSSGTRTSLVLAWNGQGWRVLYEGAGTDLDLRSLLVVGIAGDYRLFFWYGAATDVIPYLALPSDLVNPLRLPTYTYAAAATHDWPWFTAGQSDVTKVAVRVKVETLNPTTSETVKVYYAINRSSTFQLMTNSTYTTGVITASGVHTFEFPSVDSWVSTTALTGTAFRSIQFRIVFARGSTNTNSPDVLSLTLEYYKKMDAKWQFQVDVDMNTEFGGRSQKEQRAALLTAMETATLLEFTYRDPSSNSDATFYVQVQPLESAEQQGFDERGVTTLQLREV